MEELQQCIFLSIAEKFYEQDNFEYTTIRISLTHKKVLHMEKAPG